MQTTTVGRFGSWAVLVKITWAVLDPAMGCFGHPCGPFWTQLWAVFDLATGRFGHQCGPFWTRTMGRFGSWAVLVISLNLLCLSQRSYYRKQSYLDLVPSVPSRTLGDEFSPCGMIAGSLSRITPVHTHLFQVFFQCILPRPLWSSTSPSAVFWSPFRSQPNWSACHKSQDVTNKSPPLGHHSSF